jgi:hypothetical protein
MIIPVMYERQMSDTLPCTVMGRSIPQKPALPKAVAWALKGVMTPGGMTSNLALLPERKLKGR